MCTDQESEFHAPCPTSEITQQATHDCDFNQTDLSAHSHDLLTPPVTIICLEILNLIFGSPLSRQHINQGYRGSLCCEYVKKADVSLH